MSKEGLQSIDESVVKTWDVLVSEYSQLEKVSIVPDHYADQFGPYYLSGEIDDGRIVNPVIYIPHDMKSQTDDLRRDRRRIRQLEKRSGLVHKDLSDEILATFTISHEAGHVLEVLGKDINEVVVEQRKEQEKFRLPRYVSLLPRKRQEKVLLKRHGKLPSEQRADEFAAAFVKRHRDLFIAD